MTLQTRIIFSAFWGTLVYVFISIFGGPEGFSALRQLERARLEINANIEHLEKINTNLSYEFLGLRSDPDMVAGYARKLGYVMAENEKLINIRGLNERKRFSIESGVIVPVPKLSTFSETRCKILGLITTFLIFILLSTEHYYTVKKRRETIVPPTESDFMREVAEEPEELTEEL